MTARLGFRGIAAIAVIASALAAEVVLGVRAAGAATPPANDALAAATALSGPAGTATGSNVDATAEAGEPAHGGHASHSVWWRYTAPADGTLRVDLAGTGFASVLGVYERTAVGQLRQTALFTHTAAGKSPAITVQAIKATTYLLAVDGEGAATGAVKVAFAFKASTDPFTCDRWAADNGVDWDNPGTKDRPVRTPAGLSAILAPGQTGCFKSGSVIELPLNAEGQPVGGSLGGGGAPWNPITLRTEPGGTPAVIKGTFGVIASLSDIVLQDLSFRLRDGVMSSLWQVHGDRVTIRDSELSAPRGICLLVGQGQATTHEQPHQNADDFLLEGSRVHDCGVANGVDNGGTSGWHAMYVQQGQRARILHNIVYRGAYRGIQLYPNPKDAEVAFNVFDESGSNINFGYFGADPGFYTEDASVHDNIVSNATFFVPDKNPAQVYGTNGHPGRRNVFERNCLFFADPAKAGRRDLHLIVNGFVERDNRFDADGDPKYTNAAARDYRLGTGSKCVGKGPASIQPAVTPPPPPAGPVDWQGRPCTVVGTAGNDVLRGTTGNDVICGLGGDDVIRPGVAPSPAPFVADHVDGGAGTDTVSYDDVTVPVAVNLTQAAAWQLPDGPWYHDFSGIENATGSNGADTLVGSPGPNRLDGGPGNDTVLGEGGDDVLVQRAGSDGADTLGGGAGRDAVDYRRRTGRVAISPNGTADDGGAGEGDNVNADVERWLRRVVPADFDGDGDSETALYRPAGGQWLVPGATLPAYGAGGDIPVDGDFNRDGRTDQALFRASTGTWHVAGQASIAYGTQGDIPVAADYDGDGDTDVAVYRPSTGTWHVKGLPTVTHGAAGDIPAPADFDGDGAADVAVFRPSTGTWHVKGLPTVSYGTKGDVPVPGDHTGDGVAEIAVYRPSTGTWHVKGLATVTLAASATAVPGDYDGDGDVEAAVFGSNGSWVFAPPKAAMAHGGAGDLPVAARRG